MRVFTEEEEAEYVRITEEAVVEYKKRLLEFWDNISDSLDKRIKDNCENEGMPFKIGWGQFRNDLDFADDRFDYFKVCLIGCVREKV